MTTHTEMFGDDQLLEELFNDPDFIQLTALQGLVDDAQWLFWFDKHPRYQEVKLVARKLYELKYFESTMAVNEVYRSEIWTGIMAHLESKEEKVVHHRFGRLKIQQWLQYAAIFIAACVLGLWIYLQKSATVTGESYATSTSKQEFTLPDGSKLWLNKNSTADYHEDASGRRLDLIGEGYLHVTKQINDGQKVPFIVEHDGLKIEVLGTRFNVVSTPAVKLIALDEGSVRARYENQHLIMKPGEVVNVDRGILKRFPIKSNLINSWQTGTLELSNTPLSEIVVWLQLTYKKNVTSELPQYLMNVTARGQIDVSDMQTVLSSLEKIYHIKIYDQYDKFVITTNN
ncbi:fec operon regulator FecR [compost metagenome]